MNSNTDHQPVVVLGAARSGTKLLRSIIAAAPEYSEVPHDVNYIWRYAALATPDDVIKSWSANDRKRAFIHKQLCRSAGLGREDERSFVEKTVSNTLRLPFVHRILPDAKYVHLIRDGLEVTESAMRCWQEPPDYRRLLSKLRAFPWLSCGGYVTAYARTLLKQAVSHNQRLPSWGPRYAGIDEDVKQESLAYVCARQWRECVEMVLGDQHVVSEANWIEIRYEDLVNDPSAIARRLADFVGTKCRDRMISHATKHVQKPTSSKVRHLSSEDLNTAHCIVDPLAERLGYATRVAA